MFLLLDRDGVINRLVVDEEQGTIDSPLHPSQVEVDPEALRALERLTRAGIRLSIVSKQPAAAKGKTTRENLERVHEEIIRRVEQAGGIVTSSHLCFHRAEDGCSCRKPKPGLLESAIGLHGPAEWMIGD